MKKLYMLMIIIFSILVASDVNADVVRRDIKPSLICIGDIQNNQPCYSGTDIQKVSYGVNDYYFLQVPQGRYVKLSARYDLSNTTEDYVTFVLRSSKSYYQGIGTLTLGGATCESLPNSTLSYEAYGFICENPKSVVYMDYLFADDTSYTENKYYILSNLGFYNDKYIAAINTITDQQQQQHEEIMDDDTTGNASGFSSDISNFDVPNDSHAFDILGSLQSFVGNIQVSGSCSRISVPIPFTDKNFTLPCMTTDVYSVHFREIVIIWQLICRGVGYYYILVNVLKLVKETLDPFNFKLEVLDL